MFADRQLHPGQRCVPLQAGTDTLGRRRDLARFSTEGVSFTLTLTAADVILHDANALHGHTFAGKPAVVIATDWQVFDTKFQLRIR